MKKETMIHIPLAGGAEPIAPGEIWAVAGDDPAELREWCGRLAGMEGLEDAVSLVSFSQQAAAARQTGWPQARYYGEDGTLLSEFLSYESVWDVNPFEIGARRPETRKTFRSRLSGLVRLFELRSQMDRPLLALSNGEMRRCLLARALARNPRLLVLDDPAAGLDPRMRTRLSDAVSDLSESGLAVVWAYRHADELPRTVSRWFRLDESGRLVPVRKIQRARKNPPKLSRAAKSCTAEPVVEMRGLDVSFGDRVLFRNFSWTVRRGERWMLKGANGSGKTTLLALITGDSPLAYALDVSVFGQRRKIGSDLSEVRRRIGLASPELQACLGKTPEELVDAALSRRPDLLLLDEPFMNMSAAAARSAADRISQWLEARPAATAILVSHREDETPEGFDRILDLNNMI